MTDEFAGLGRMLIVAGAGIMLLGALGHRATFATGLTKALLTSVGFTKQMRNGRPVSHVLSTPEAVAAPELTRPFDALAVRLHGSGLRSVGITAALLDEGATTVALGVAMSLSAMQRGSVLLVDGNRLEPSLSEDGRKSQAAGLSDCVRGDARLEDTVVTTSWPGLFFLPSGSGGDERAALDDLPEIVRAALDRFRFVIVDLPPVLAAEQVVLLWEEALAQILFVIRVDSTPVTIVQRGLSKLNSVRQPGIVLNRFRARPNASQQITLARR